MLVLAEALADTPAPHCPVTPSQKENAFQVGLHIQNLLPNRLPDFVGGLPVYGPIVGIPFFGDNIQLQAFYGTLTDFWLYTFEANYRFNVSTPYFTGFALAGGHYMHYSRLGSAHRYVGPNFGLGASIDMSQNFDVNLLMKVYAQERALFSFGGGFALLF